MPEELSRLEGRMLAESGGGVVAELRETLRRAGELLRDLEEKLASRASEEGPGASLSPAEHDVREIAEELVQSEHQVQRLMNLYVATYQLHSSLDPAVVCQTIAEITVNLLGAESFVLLLRQEQTEDCQIVLREGDLPGGAQIFSGSTYSAGDPLVDLTLADGQLRLGPTSDSEVFAAVPLRMENELVGVLVVLRLLPHKPLIRPSDRELLDLLSAHAAAALLAARLFAAKDRRLHSLESLFRLARGE